MTQKYDMHSLRALQNLETSFLEKLSKVYGCDPEDLEVDLDLLRIYNDEPAKRRPSIVSYDCDKMMIGILILYVYLQADALKSAPGDVTQLIDELVGELERIDSLPK